MKRKILTLFAFGTLIATATSCYQLFYLTDPETGFFKTGFGKTGWILTLFIAVIAACIGLVASQRPKLPKKSTEKPIGFSILSIAYAILLFWETMRGEFILSFSEQVWWINTILCLLAALAILLIGFNRYLRLNLNGILSLFILAYALLRLVLPFTRYSHLPTVAQTSYELCYLALHLLFWLYAAMLENNVRRSNTARFLLPVTLLSSFICAVYAIPELAAKLTGNPALHQGSSDPVLALVFSAYSMCYCFSVFRPRKKRVSAEEALQ